MGDEVSNELSHFRLFKQGLFTTESQSKKCQPLYLNSLSDLEYIDFFYNTLVDCILRQVSADTKPT